jgi:SAM-dependent methyltransferase
MSAAHETQHATDGDILRAMGELAGKNRIAEAFYNGPRFQKFRFWENLFLFYAGGLKGARRQILRYLPPLENGSLLEVGIGDGDNVRLLPATTHVTGIDIAVTRLAACRRRCEGRMLPLRLALAEGERIPFADREFNAVLCVGGFNFFSDPGQALAEMARVTRPGGRIVVADEIPDFLEYGWGHRIWWPSLDSWLMKRWFGPEFCDMVLTNKIDVHSLAAAALKDWTIHRIWRGYGYCLVGERQ